MSKPSIVLVPGSFALPEFYDDVVNAVVDKGYEIHALHLPSVGLKTGSREGQPPTMYDDATFIAQKTQELAGEGKDVILVAHSYAGVPMTQSTKGLGKAERQEQGKEGGIVQLAYMTALVPVIGLPAAGVSAKVHKENEVELRVDENGWMYHSDIPKSAAIIFSDLPREEGEELMKSFPPHSAVSFAGELTHAGYKDFPVSYLVCEKDLIIPLPKQREGIELIEKESGRKVDVTSIRTGHCPNTSAPQEVVNWILDVAGKA